MEPKRGKREKVEAGGGRVGRRRVHGEERNGREAVRGGGWGRRMLPG